MIFLYTRGIIDDKKEHLRQVGFYIGGAVLGLLTMAIYSQYLFRQQMLFLPIVFTTSLLLTYNLGSFAYSLSKSDPIRNSYKVAIEGFFHAPVSFYIFYLTPTRIADKHRFTQEVNPAGTIITMVLCISEIVSAVFTAVILGILEAFDADWHVQRLIAVVILVIAIITFWSAAK